MEITPTALEGCWIIKTEKIKDHRGYFREIFHKKKFQKVTGKKICFVQTNHVFSLKGVLRGLHLQRPPHEQSKLISVINGEILDISLDVRMNSPTFGKYIKERLSFQNQKQLFLSSGFAHGFITLSDSAQVTYQCDANYHYYDEDGISYNDLQLGIDWEYPIEKIILSEKDQNQKAFKDFIPVCL